MVKEQRPCPVWAQPPVDTEFKPQHCVAVHHPDPVRNLLYFESTCAAEKWLARFTRAYFEPTPRLFQRYEVNGSVVCGLMPSEVTGELLEGRMCPEQDQDQSGSLTHHLQAEYKTQPLFRFCARRNSDEGWLPPVPVVSLSTDDPGEGFLGPWLRGGLRVDEDEEPDLSWTATVDKSLKRCGLDAILHVRDKMERLGLDPDDNEEVLRRVNRYATPDIECALDESWNVGEVLLDGPLRQGHDRLSSKPFTLAALRDVAFDLEGALLDMHRDRRWTVMDVQHFWTSVEVRQHLRRIARDASRRCGNAELLCREFESRVGSYLHELRRANPERPRVVPAVGEAAPDRNALRNVLASPVSTDNAGTSATACDGGNHRDFTASNLARLKEVSRETDSGIARLIGINDHKAVADHSRGKVVPELYTLAKYAKVYNKILNLQPPIRAEQIKLVDLRQVIERQ
jgi:hypothetical protein